MLQFCRGFLFHGTVLARRRGRERVSGRVSLTSAAYLKPHQKRKTSDFPLDRNPLVAPTTARRPSRPTLNFPSNEAIRARRSNLFTAEKTRQLEAVRRVEKIEVLHRGLPEDCTLIMNKNLSTPYDCTLHLNQMITRRSALALVNGKPWDMHRPLEEDCELQLLHFMEENPTEANLAFWRTGSLLLSYVADRAFRDDIAVEVHSWPYQNVQTGSFICDVDLKLTNWTPKEEELRVMSLMVSRLVQKRLPVERLHVSQEFALDVFAENRFKCEQIPQIAQKTKIKNDEQTLKNQKNDQKNQKNNEKNDQKNQKIDEKMEKNDENSAINQSKIKENGVTLYRVDDHVEISSGPMVGNTGLFGRHQVTAVHPLDCHGIGRLFRFQGVALPSQQPLNYFAWNILVNRARTFNDSPVPTKNISDSEKNNSQIEKN